MTATRIDATHYLVAAMRAACYWTKYKSTETIHS